MAKYFKKVKSYENLKEQYKTLLKKNHPDNGGEVSKMQEINAEYDALFKIWKDRHESETGETVTETAESTRSRFYTENGWAGSNYNSSLDVKDVSKIVKTYIKEKYPTWKFSVRISRYSGGCSLRVECLESPVKMYKTADDLRAEGTTEHIKTTSYNGKPLEFDSIKDEIQDIMRKLHANGFLPDSHTDEDFFTAYEKAVAENEQFYAVRTEIFASVLEDVKAFTESYRYSDCDGMIDYFSTNFWTHYVCSGVKFVEKTPRIQEPKNEIKKADTQSAQTKKGSFAEDLCKTTENENMKNADTNSIAENTEESKEEKKNTIPRNAVKLHITFLLSNFTGKKATVEKDDFNKWVATLENGETYQIPLIHLRNGNYMQIDKVQTAEETVEEKVVAENATTTEQEETTTTAPTFEELARAFVTGKTVKAQKKKEEPKNHDNNSKLKNRTKSANYERTAEEPPMNYERTAEEPPKPQKVGYGYEESSDFFTDAEIESLENGEQVTKPHEYRKDDVMVYFSTPYTLEGARLVYYMLSAGQDAKYSGFIVNHKFYNDKEKISAEMKTDINTEVKRLLPSEQEAEKNAGELNKREKDSVDFYRNNDFLREAQEYFYKGTDPELVLYHPYNSFGYDECIKYLLNPTEYTETQAKEYIEGYYMVEILKDYMQYSRTAATLAKIRADKGSETQKLKRIMDCIDKEKSVKVTLTNGSTVKVNADAVKRIGYSGYISSYNVSACDRQYLRKNEYNREEDIKAEDITQITHGQRVLYKAA